MSGPSLLAAIALGFVGLTIRLTGGGTIDLFGLPIRANRDGRFFIAATVALAIFLLHRRDIRRAAAAWLLNLADRRGSALAVMLSVAVGAIALSYGTFAAGGSDSYCYLNQAELFAAGRTHDAQLLASSAPWPDAVLTFVPPGHIPAAAGAPAVVPMCLSGYAALMAQARRVAGREAMFWVVPLLAGIGVYATFLLGRRAMSPGVGLAAATLLASSPAFLHQSMQPMSDVPACTFWAITFVAAVRREHSVGTALTCGVAASLAFLMRPNLAPLVAVVGAMVCMSRPLHLAQSVRRGLAFAVGVAPAVVLWMLLQGLMYGGLLTSGYGNVGPLFSAAHIAPNAANYGTWLTQTQTPVVILAIVSPLVAYRAGARYLWWLLAFSAATVAVYLPYSVFDNWWYLRFLLPAYPPLFVLTASCVASLLGRHGEDWRRAGLLTVTCVLAAVGVAQAKHHDVFKARDFEWRFRAIGAYVRDQLPQNALVVTEDLGGAVRFYSGKPTLQWKALDPLWLDRAVEWAAQQGRRTFLLFEGDEEERFRARFGAVNRIGALNWPPRLEINRTIRLYDAADLERVTLGEAYASDRVNLPPPWR